MPIGEILGRNVQFVGNSACAGNEVDREIQSVDCSALQVFRTRGGRLSAARTIPERENALAGPSRRQKGVCSQIPGAKMEIPAWSFHQSNFAAM